MLRPRISCVVCYDTFYIKDIRFLSCGHCFCTKCTDTLKRSASPQNPSKCPICREQTAHPGQQLFIDFVDNGSVESPDTPDAAIARQARHVTNGLNAMGADSDDMRVLRAGREIKKVVDAMRAANREEDGAVFCLVEAIEDFKTRIAPVCANLPAREAEITALKEKISTKQDKLRTVKQEVSSLIATVGLLQKQNAALERQNEAALEAASRATAEVLSLRNIHLEAKAAKKEVEGLVEDVREKDREIGRYRDWIDQHKKKSEKKAEANTIKTNVLERKLEKMRRELSKQRTGTRQRESSSFMQVDESEQSLVVTYGELEDNDMEYSEPLSSAMDEELVASSSTFPGSSPSPSNQPLSHTLENVPLGLNAPPRFTSTWNLPNVKTGKKGTNSNKIGTLPLKVDAKGQLLGNVVLGSRMRMDKKLVDRL